MGKKVRVFVQLADNLTNNQALSKMYDLDNTDGNIFNLQDELVRLILPDLHQALNSLGFAAEKPLLKAIS